MSDDEAGAWAFPAAVTGAVRGQYLPETKQVDPAGVLQHEGEVTVYLRYQTGEREGRMTLMSGHSAGNWAPAPIPLAQAALAASGVANLTHAGLRTGFSIEIAPEPRQIPGSRDQSQLNADAGLVEARRGPSKGANSRLA